MKKTVALLILLVSIAFSCERDDICTLDTPTTPRITIEFFDIQNPEQQNPKNVFKCRVQGIGNDEALPELDGASPKQIILLPLKTTETSTQYSIYSNYALNNNNTPNDPSDDYPTGNEDIITISYVPEEVYVSRACGFKTVFKNITITVETDTDNWIEIIQSVNDNQILENEETANFSIFH
ncbi:hypothetical protein BZARG_2349 [Bizionia argentinensis JUB59]|uniref:Uncharacterized protein n=1 Tax=Bizionia argentinensis JUB59 TaxID=1046627 RepID=G2ECA7_9FLAO|nr:DUF6452 family protein [Bizionia argentinensis]EGV43940.1 hypothetical protein BZARG_2349 [Bizionia argentinensis JUB59]